jgi:hypothetical protein
MDDEIKRYLQCHLQSKLAKPVDVLHVTVVAGGDHGDTSFQFGASVSAKLSGSEIIYFEVSVCELICRKDTVSLIESTILPTLTSGLKVVATSPFTFITTMKAAYDASLGKHALLPNMPQQQQFLTLTCTSHATWRFKPWHWADSRCRDTGACNAPCRCSAP